MAGRKERKEIRSEHWQNKIKRNKFNESNQT